MIVTTAAHSGNVCFADALVGIFDNVVVLHRRAFSQFVTGKCKK